MVSKILFNIFLSRLVCNSFSTLSKFKTPIDKTKFSAPCTSSKPAENDRETPPQNIQFHTLNKIPRVEIPKEVSEKADKSIERNSHKIKDEVFEQFTKNYIFYYGNQEHFETSSIERTSYLKSKLKNIPSQYFESYDIKPVIIKLEELTNPCTCSAPFNILNNLDSFLKAQILMIDFSIGLSKSKKFLNKARSKKESIYFEILFTNELMGNFFIVRNNFYKSVQNNNDILKDNFHEYYDTRIGQMLLFFENDFSKLWKLIFNPDKSEKESINKNKFFQYISFIFLTYTNKTFQVLFKTYEHLDNNDWMVGIGINPIFSGNLNRVLCKKHSNLVNFGGIENSTHKKIKSKEERKIRKRNFN